MVQGPAGSPWDATAGDRFDHIGYWSDDIATDKQRLAGRAAPVDFDASSYGRPFAYHRRAGLDNRIELVDSSVQRAFLDSWTSGGQPMPPLVFGRRGSAVTARGGIPGADRDASAAQCHAVLVDFLHAIDRGTGNQALALFTPDASLDAHGELLTSHEQIAAS